MTEGLIYISKAWSMSASQRSETDVVYLNLTDLVLGFTNTTWTFLVSKDSYIQITEFFGIPLQTCLQWNLDIHNPTEEIMTVLKCTLRLFE